MLEVRTAALPASLRRTNQRTVISLLFRMGVASRADLAKAAGISQPTAGKIISELLELGVLQEAEPTVSNGHEGSAGNGQRRLGRPGQMVRLDDRHLRFLAIKIGVTTTSVAAFPVAVPLRDEWTVEFSTPNSPDAWVKELEKAIAKIPRTQLWGAVISVPGIVDEAKGKVLFCPNLHWLEKVDLPALVQSICRAPALLVQEIRALALGHLTAEVAAEDFFLVDFGQGVGGAIVSESKLYTHPAPLSGELGHTPVPRNSRPCGCGAVGCLETLVSQRGLLESFASARGLKSPSWKMLATYLAEHGLEPWLADSLDTTAKVIAGALNVLGINRVVVTGLLTELPGFVYERLSTEIKKGAMWARFGTILCETAPHRRAAGLVAVGIDRLILPADDGGGRLRGRLKRARKTATTRKLRAAF
jgi:predicted NBD/HSP70 family sugar kinase